MKKNIILLSAFCSVIALVSLSLFKYNPPFKAAVKKYFRAVKVKEKVNSNSYYASIVKNDPYALHKSTARKKGLKVVKDDTSLNVKVANKVLVKTKNSDGYKINRLTHSYPFLTKRSNEVLKEIGKDFKRAAGENSYFVVTSLTRTVKQQNRLAKRNVNATRGVSSHSYGVSFDISYVQFNGKKRRNKKLQRKLEQILISYQKNGEIYLIMEKRVNCYHVTVR